MKTSNLCVIVFFILVNIPVYTSFPGLYIFLTFFQICQFFIYTNENPTFSLHITISMTFTIMLLECYDSTLSGLFIQEHNKGTFFYTTINCTNS